MNGSAAEDRALMARELDIGVGAAAFIPKPAWCIILALSCVALEG